jgi:hypothetical protein
MSQLMVIRQAYTVKGERPIGSGSVQGQTDGMGANDGTE